MVGGATAGGGAVALAARKSEGMGNWLMWNPDFWAAGGACQPLPWCDFIHKAADGIRGERQESRQIPADTIGGFMNQAPPLNVKM